MAKQTTTTVAELKPSLVSRVKDFYQEVMTEMSKVTWPSKDELKSSTSVVMLILAVMGAIIYMYDVIFQICVVGLYRLI